MNTSYKIVLLGAFVLFVAVVGYYIIFGGDNESTELAEQTPPTVVGNSTPPPPPASQQRPTNNTPPRNTLATTRQPEPETETEREITVDTGNQGTPDFIIGTGEIATPDPDTGVIDNTATVDNGLTREPRTETNTGTPETTETERVAIGENNTPRVGPGATNGGTTQTTTTQTERVRPAPRYPDTLTTTERSTTTERTTTTRPRTYTIQGGDTFSSIAAEVYGDSSAWFEIAQANPSVDPKALQVGQVIVLPDLEAATREREVDTPPAPGQDQTYTVRPNDNLSRIAQRFYGDSTAWELIHNRNRNLIGDNPNNIRVGMELIIPQPYSGAD